MGKNSPGIISDLALESRPSTIMERVMVRGVARVASLGGKTGWGQEGGLKEGVEPEDNKGTTTRGRGHSFLL